MALHILTPESSRTPDSLMEESLTDVSDMIVDLRDFPFSIHKVQTDWTCLDVTSDLFAALDYWAVTREWLIQFTERTGLQDRLAIDGYGIWWTLSGQRFVPVISELGDSFAWIDLLDAVHRRSPPDSVVVYGQHNSIIYLAGQVFDGTEIQVKSEAAVHTRGVVPPRKVGLLVVRLLLGIVYLIYALVRHPDIVFFSSTNLLRKTAAGAKRQLRDVYLGEVAQALQKRGWRTSFVEKYGWHASWHGLAARGFLFFPSDILFLVSKPVLHKLKFYRRTICEWHKKWKEVLPHLASHLRYRERDIAPLVLPLIAREFTHHAPNLQVMIRVWRFVLRLWRPQLLYVNNSYGRSAVPAIVAAKSLDIPTIEQQHGVINRDHIPYLVPKHLGTESRFPLCDNMVVWGNYSKRLLVGAGAYEPAQVAVCGFPRIDSLLGELPPRPRTLAQLAISPEAQVALYTSNKLAQGFLTEILDSIQSVEDSANVFWIIKLHPAEKTREVWELAIRQRQLQTVRVVGGDFDFYALLAACDIHISFTSTTLIEAAILGKINLGLEIARIPDPVGYADAKAFLPVIPRQLGPVVCKVLRDPAQQEALLREQKAFADDWCLHDGKAVSRIVDFVESVIADEIGARV